MFSTFAVAVRCTGGTLKLVSWLLAAKSSLPRAPPSRPMAWSAAYVRHAFWGWITPWVRRPWPHAGLSAIEAETCCTVRRGHTRCSPSGPSVSLMPRSWRVTCRRVSAGPYKPALRRAQSQTRCL